MALDAELPRQANRVHLRGLLVVAVMALGLSISLPNLATAIYGRTWAFDFDTCDGVICGVGDTAYRAGLRVGDRLQRRQMTAEDWYAVVSTGFRVPQPSQTVTLVVRRGDQTYVFRQTPRPTPESTATWPLILAGKVAVVVVAILASALFLVNPSPVAGALALFAVGEFTVDPSFYSFLPAWAYVCLTVLTFGVFNAAGVAGFLWLALALGRNCQRNVPRILLFLFVALTLWGAALYLAFLWLAPNTLEGYYWIITACFLVPGMPLLIQTAFRGTSPSGERLAAGLVAIVGAATIAPFLLEALGKFASLHHINALTQMTEDPANRLLGSLDVVSFLAAVGAAYVIARDRVVDTGLIFSRILSNASIVLGVLLTLGFLNWALAPRLSAYPFAIPLEVVCAVAIGYWFSGLRDVSTALSLAAVDAPAAAMRGNPENEYRALDRALGLAERTRQRGLISEIHARFAFSAWANCDDAVLERHLRPLSREPESRSLRGLRAFVRAASSGASEDPPETTDLAEWRARSSLLLSARSDDASKARDHAIDAVHAADTDGSPWLRVLARVALAELSQSDRGSLLNEAYAIALHNRAKTLAESLAALQADARDCGLLQAFVEMRIRKVRPACPALEIEFCSGNVRVLGKPVEFSEKERALLFTIAASKAIRPEPLTDALWPESDGDVALNALKACLHRLRRRSGDPRIVRRVGRAYALHPGTSVDLWELDVALSEGKTGEIAAMREAFRKGAQRRATLGSWFTPFENLVARRLLEVERVTVRMNGADSQSPP